MPELNVPGPRQAFMTRGFMHGRNFAKLCLAAECIRGVRHKPRTGAGSSECCGMSLPDANLALEFTGRWLV